MTSLRDIIDELAGVALASSCAAVVVVRDGLPEFVQYDADEAGVEQRLRGAIVAGAFVVAIVALKSRDGISGSVVIEGVAGWRGSHARPLLRSFARRFVQQFEEVRDANS